MWSRSIDSFNPWEETIKVIMQERKCSNCRRCSKANRKLQKEMGGCHMFYGTACPFWKPLHWWKRLTKGGKHG